MGETEETISIFTDAERAEALVLAWRRRRVMAEAECQAAQRQADAADARLAHPRRGDVAADLKAEARACADRVASLARTAAALAQREDSARDSYYKLTSIQNTETKIDRNASRVSAVSA